MTEPTLNHNAKRNYEACAPRQFGDLHQRMKFLMDLVQGRQGEFPNDVWHAIWDLKTEVENHVPENPPFGRRAVNLKQ